MDTFAVLVQEEGIKLECCAQAELCESSILTFDAFWLWLVQRLNRFAGSLALGHRVYNLFLLWCCVPCFAGLCFWSWTLRTGRRKLATAKKNNLVSLFERMEPFYLPLFQWFVCVPLHVFKTESQEQSGQGKERCRGFSKLSQGISWQ